jgi:glycosyltransferase involved in cell wall biosynthesis
MANIAIYIGRHLCTAPRPCKEADALASDGHQVTVSGLWSDPRLIERDWQLLKGRAWKFVPYVDCRTDQRVGRARWFLVRLWNRCAREMFQRTGRIHPDVFGYGTRQLTRHAERSAADLTIFHSEGGLWAARKLSRSGRRVGVDFEDWFSQDLPPRAKASRPVTELGKLEAAALRRARYVTTTSQAMACALAAAYAVPVPAVIYNTFPRSAAAMGGKAPSHSGSGPVSLHWFSQTLGRGLETLFAALPQLEGPWKLQLRADDPSGYAMTLAQMLTPELRSRVEFVPTVPNAELPLRIAEHDIGLAVDVSDIPSRNLTITNKLFQYLEGGLAVVASNTAGHQEVLQQASAAGEIFTAGDSASLAAALTRLCADRGHLLAAKDAAKTASETIFAHERQLPVYTELAARALR